jgi:hypothetical protein
MWTVVQILDGSEGTNVDGELDGHMDKGVSHKGKFDIDKEIGETVGRRHMKYPIKDPM